MSNLFPCNVIESVPFQVWYTQYKYIYILCCSTSYTTLALSALPCIRISSPSCRLIAKNNTSVVYDTLQSVFTYNVLHRSCTSSIGVKIRCRHNSLLIHVSSGNSFNVTLLNKSISGERVSAVIAVILHHCSCATRDALVANTTIRRKYGFLLQ